MATSRLVTIKQCIGLCSLFFGLSMAITLPAQAEVTVTYTYDELDRLQTVVRSDAPELAYAHDVVGNITSETITQSPDFDGDLQADFADLDDDNDGMTDLFENQYGLNSLDPNDAVLDPDNDGRDNLQEFLDMTNPLIADAPAPEPEEVNVPALPLLSAAMLAVLLLASVWIQRARATILPLVVLAFSVTFVDQIQAQSPPINMPTLERSDSGIGDIADPGWHLNVSDTSVSHEEARLILGDPDVTHLAPNPESLAIPVANSAFALPNDYNALAEALENDPRRIYQYVRNHFEYVPYYGALKGAYLTLHERSGNDFDQAALLIEILRAAGYTANFRYGEATVTTSNAPQLKAVTDWLGVEQNATLARNAFRDGGIPTTLSGGLLRFDRVWVEVTIGGSIVSLDPAFKLSEKYTGIDLDTATGYNESALLAAAGGTLGTDFIQNMSESGLNAYLTARTTQLKSYLQQNNPNDTVQAFLGGYSIIPDESTTLPASLPLSVAPTDPAWSSIPANFITTMTIVHGGINTQFETPDIAGRKLSIRYASSGVIPDPPAGAIDFGAVAVGQVGSTLSFNPFTNSNAVAIQIHSTIVGGDASAFQVVAGGLVMVPANGTASQALQMRLTGVGQTGGRKNSTLRIETFYLGDLVGSQDLPITGVVENRTAEIYLDDVLQVAEASPTGAINDLVVSIDHPYASNSGTYQDASVTFKVVRSGQYVLSSGFGGDTNSTLLAERQRQLNRMSFDGTAPDSPEIYSETLNVIGLTWMQQTQLSMAMLDAITGVRPITHHRFGITGQEEAYFVDVKTQNYSAVNRELTPREGVFQTWGFLSSAMEHSVLEQLQGEENPGISTIKIFAINNQNNGKLFLADGTNYAAIRPQLSNYSTTQLDAFQSLLVNVNRRLILPENGTVALNQWSGIGYVDYLANPNGSRSQGMIIGGGLNGGFGSIPAFIDPPRTYNEYFPEIVPQTNILRNYGLDPVDLNSGAFVSQMTDLALGGSGVRGLAFTRSYDSQQVTEQSAGLGRGWTHNNRIYLTTHSSVNAALGKGNPFQSLPIMIASHFQLRLLEATQPVIRNWGVSALIADWAMDQLLNTSVTVHAGSKASTYQQMPDGSFIAPAGQTAELVKLGDNTFELRERFGTVHKFNANDYISSTTDIDGNALTFTYSGDKLTQVKDTYNRTLTLSYNGDDLTAVSDSTGRSVTYGLTGETLTTVNALESANWQYSYDSLFRLKTVIDPMSTTIVDNFYNDFDRVISQIAPRQTGTALYKLHYTGFTSSEEDPNGSRTTYHYNMDGRTVAVEDALGNKTKTMHDGQGQTMMAMDRLGNMTEARYDNANNVVEVINAEQESTAFVYDSQERLIRTTAPMNHDSETDYDTENHPVRFRDALNNEVGITYQIDGLPNTITNARNIVNTQTYDGFGQINTQKMGSQPLIDTNYNNRGLLTSITDQASANTSFIYDDRGLVTERTDALNKKTTSVYNTLGLLISQTDRNGNTSTISYTPTPKVEALTFPAREGTATQFAHLGFSVSFTYDNKDRVSTMVDQHGTTTNTYDVLGRLMSHTDPNGYQVQYAYDVASNVTQITYPDGNTVSYEYDELNRISGVSIDWLNSDATPNYDAAGRLTSISHFNGTSTTYDYDVASRLTGLTHYKGINTAFADYQYILDVNGNRTQAIITNEPIQPAGLFNGVRSKTLNATKNRITAAVTHEPVTLDYDDEGQLEQYQGLTTSTGYGFDAAGRVTYYATADQYSTYQYDGAGNRISATRSDPEDAGIQTTKHYVYDASGNLLAELNDQGQIQKYFIYGLGLMAMVDVNTNGLYVYHFEGAGHTVAMTDDAQSITHRYAYEPYGRIMAREETVPQPFTYAGQVGIYAEAENLYYMRARYYDANLQQFISEDPAGFVDGANLYAYVGGNPLGFVDPTGEVLANVGAGIINLGIDIAIRAATGQNIDLTSNVVAFGAGFTGAAAAQRIGQVANGVRFISSLGGSGIRGITAAEVGANAIAAGTINATAGALNGDGFTAKNFAFGAAGSVVGSAAIRGSESISGLGFGPQGVANSAGKSVGTLVESFGAGSGAFTSGSGSSNHGS